MIAPTTIAARIWADLPGDARDKAHALKSVMSELVVLRNVALAEQRRAERVHTAHKLRPTAEMVARIVGLPVGKTAPYRVCIHGINTSVADVFAIAAAPGHPLQAECQAFLSNNRLSLVEGRKNPGKIGRKRQIVTQAPLEPTPAQILERVKATAAGVLERRDAAYRYANVLTAGGGLNQAHANAMTISGTQSRANLANTATTSFVGRECTATMTDHSGGKVSDVPVERGRPS